MFVLVYLLVCFGCPTAYGVPGPGIRSEPRLGSVGSFNQLCQAGESNLSPGATEMLPILLCHSRNSHVGNFLIHLSPPVYWYLSRQQRWFLFLHVPLASSTAYIYIWERERENTRVCARAHITCRVIAWEREKLEQEASVDRWLSCVGTSELGRLRLKLGLTNSLCILM